MKLFLKGFRCDSKCGCRAPRECSRACINTARKGEVDRLGLHLREKQKSQAFLRGIGTTVPPTTLPGGLAPRETRAKTLMRPEGATLDNVVHPVGSATAVLRPAQWSAGHGSPCMAIRRRTELPGQSRAMYPSEEDRRVWAVRAIFRAIGAKCPSCCP